MNIVIVNQPLGNRGDEAAHRALVREINKRFPEAKVEVFSPNGNPAILKEISVKNPNNYYNSEKISYRFYRYFVRYILYSPALYSLWGLQPIFRAWINKLKWADVVVCAPGGICMGGFMNWSHVSFLAIAKYYHKPIIYFCRSIGPFSDETKDKKVFKRVSIDLLKHFDYISLRDGKSQKLADSLGVKYHSTTDAAFLDNTEVFVPNEIKAAIGDKKYIVFVPNSLTWHFYYKNTPQDNIDTYYIDIIKHIEQRYPDCQIVMLPQTFMNPSWGNDVDYFRNLHKKYPSNQITVLDDIYGSDVQQAVIKGSDMVIGARYHSVVFAINQARPFCALSYEHKIEGLLQILKSTDSMIDIKDIFADKDVLTKATEQTLGIIDKAMADKSDRTVLRDKAKRIALEQFDNIEQTIRRKCKK